MAYSLSLWRHECRCLAARRWFVVRKRRFSRQRPVIVNDCFKRFVDTMLAPGLGEHFQLHVGSVAPFLLVISPHRLHLLQIQRQPPLLADGQQSVIVAPRIADGFD